MTTTKSRELVALSALVIACSSSQFSSAPRKGDSSSGGEGGEETAGSPGRGGSAGAGSGSGSGGTQAGAADESSGGSDRGDGGEPPTGSGGRAGTHGSGGSYQAGGEAGDSGNAGERGAGMGGSSGGTGGSGGSAGAGGSVAGTGNSNAGSGGSAGMGAGGTPAGAGGGSAGTGGASAGSGGSSAGTGGSTGGTGGATGGTGGSTGGTGGSAGGTGGSIGGMGGSSAGTGGSCTVGALCHAKTDATCDVDAVYDSDCSCPDTTHVKDGTYCNGSPTNDCDLQDTCAARVCVPKAKPWGTHCGVPDDPNNCSANFCDGSGQCIADQPAFAGQTCGAVSCSVGVVTGVGACDGINTGCSQGTIQCYGPCNAGNTACQYQGIQQVYTTSDGALGDVTNNTDYVYLAHGGTTITRVSKSDWSSSAVYTGSSAVGGTLLATDTALYFTEGPSPGGNLKCVPAAGGIAQMVASGQSPYALVTDGVNVFWSDHQDSDSASTMNHIYKTPVTSCMTTAVAKVTVTTGGAWIMPNIAVTASSIYFMGVDASSTVISQITNCSGGNCAPVDDMLGPVPSSTFTNGGPHYMGLSGSNVYFYALSSATSASIFWSFSSSGTIPSTPKNLYTTAGGPGSYSTFVAGDTFFYMQNYKVPLAGGSSGTPVTTAPKWAGHLVGSEDRDESFLYFVSSGYWNDLSLDASGTPNVTNKKGVYVSGL